MRQLEYPFDADLIIKKRKSLRRELLSDSGNGRIRKKIAVLGGSTTANVVQILDLFLLNQGIEAEFYESEYNKYYEDAVYGTEELSSFLPDLVFIHTGIHNVQAFPLPGESAEQVEEKLEAEFSRFRTMWEKLTDSSRSVWWVLIKAICIRDN